MDYGLDDRVRFPAGVRDFTLLHSVQNDSRATQAPIQWVLKAFRQGVKRTGREADHSLPSNAEVKKR
jgi:hypothetical protein